MNRISIKLLSVLAIFIFVAVIPIAIFATNEDISIVTTTNSELKQEYIIYIKGMSTQNFKYAFATDANTEEIDLYYINSISDLGGNQVAFLDTTTYENLFSENQTILMWVKDKEENLILKGVQLDFTKALSDESLEKVETITTRIEVEIADSEEDTTTIRNENVNGVEETAAVGYIKILDDESATYYYEMKKTSSSEEYNQLMTLAEQIKDKYEEMDMYEKVQIGTQFDDLYSKVTSEAKWQKVQNMVIEQPEESIAGEQYIVLLKKVSQQGETIMDVQFLTTFDAYKPNVEKEEVVIQETTKLPITYDNSSLFIVLGIVMILLVAVFIKMKILKQKISKD